MDNFCRDRHVTDCPYSPMDCELEGFRFCRRVVGLDRVSSTNDHARKLATECPDAVGTLVVADCQTQGRGRSDHSWHSPAGGGIYASLIVNPVVSPERATFVTLAAGLALHRALAEFLDTNPNLDVKWPNDILLDDRKLAGILVESSMRDGEMSWLIIGIGINVSQVEFPAEIRNRAVSLAQATGRQLSRHDILLRVLGHLDHGLDVLESGDFQTLRRDWESVSSFARGRKVKFFENGRPVMGITCGLKDDGALLVYTRQEQTVAVYGGEIFEY